MTAGIFSVPHPLQGAKDGAPRAANSLSDGGRRIHRFRFFSILKKGGAVAATSALSRSEQNRRP
jgi:hypothetical protein